MVGWGRRGRWWSALVVALAIGAAACGSSASSSPDSRDPTVSYTFVAVGAADGQALDQSARLIVERLDAVGLDATATATDDGVRVDVFGEGADAATVDALASSGELRFRPVLATPGLDSTAMPTADTCPAGEPPQSDPPDQVVYLPQCDPTTGALVAWFQVGPTLLTGAALESASAASGPQGQWAVNPVFHAGVDGIDAFNNAARLCFGKAPECPTGQLALVVDGRVLSAPMINEDSFERDQIQISGNFTEQSSKQLAAILDSGALPVQLEPAN